jgi:hypothetical protein
MTITGFLSTSVYGQNETAITYATNKPIGPPKDIKTNTYCKNIIASYYNLPPIVQSMPNYNEMTPFLNETIENIDFTGRTQLGGLTTSVGAVFQGFLQFPKKGRWWMCIESDNGSNLYIDNKSIVSIQYYSGRNCSSYWVSTAPLVTAMRIEFFQEIGPFNLYLTWKLSGTPTEIIPSCAFSNDTSNFCQNIMISYYKLPTNVQSMPNYNEMIPFVNETVEKIDFQGSDGYLLGGSFLSTNVGAVFQSYLQFPTRKGNWQVCIESDHGSNLYFDKKDFASVKYYPWKNCSYYDAYSLLLVTSIRIEFFQEVGPYHLYLTWKNLINGTGFG